MQLKLFALLIALLFAAKQNKNVAESDENCAEIVNKNAAETIFVKIEEDEYAKINKKESSSLYIGVSYNVNRSKWQAQRYSKHEKKKAHNGNYENEKTAAHASDTLARKLIANGEQGHKLNFPYNATEVYPEKQIKSSQHIGVFYREGTSTWLAHRWSKQEKRMLYNRGHENEETAAHASDTLARKLIANGEEGHNLNFPFDDTEVYQEEKINSSQYIGVSYDVRNRNWLARRHSKHEKKNLNNGSHKNEETAAHASDTLARKLMENGEKTHKLNFPNDDTEVFAERKRKRKRPNHEDLSQTKNN